MHSEMSTMDYEHALGYAIKLFIIKLEQKYVDVSEPWTIHYSTAVNDRIMASIKQITLPNSAETTVRISICDTSDLYTVSPGQIAV
jgi:hypothetical protein